MSKSSRAGFYDKCTDSIWACRRIGVEVCQKPIHLLSWERQSLGAVAYMRVGLLEGVRCWGHKICMQTQKWDIRSSHEQTQLWCHLTWGKGWRWSLLHQRQIWQGATWSSMKERHLRVQLWGWQMLFSSFPECAHTLVLHFVEWSEVDFGRICLPRREGKLFEGNYLTTAFWVPGSGGCVW